MIELEDLGNLGSRRIVTQDSLAEVIRNFKDYVDKKVQPTTVDFPNIPSPTHTWPVPSSEPTKEEFNSLYKGEKPESMLDIEKTDTVVFNGKKFLSEDKATAMAEDSTSQLRARLEELENNVCGILNILKDELTRTGYLSEQVKNIQSNISKYTAMAMTIDEQQQSLDKDVREIEGYINANHSFIEMMKQQTLTGEENK